MCDSCIRILVPRSVSAAEALLACDAEGLRDEIVDEENYILDEIVKVRAEVHSKLGRFEAFEHALSFAQRSKSLAEETASLANVLRQCHVRRDMLGVRYARAPADGQ